MVAVSDQALRIERFAGLNEYDHPSLLDDNELAVCQNMYVDTDGTIKKRPGLTLLNSTLDKDVNFLDNFSVSPTLVYSMFTNGVGSNLYSVDDAGVPGTQDTVSSVFWGVSYDSKFYYGTSTGIKTWDGTSVASLASAGGTIPTSTRDGIFHKGRLFVVGSEANNQPYRLHFTAPDNFTGDPAGVVSWPTTNTLDVISKDRGDYINALVSFNDTLYIFKSRSIWALYVQGTSSSDWVLRQINTEIGCKLGHNVLVVNNIMYFVGIQGFEANLYRFDGSNFENLSKNINFNASFSVDSFTVYKAFAVWGDFLVLINHVRVAEAGAYSKHLLVYNYINQTWSRWILPNLLPLTNITSLILSPKNSKKRSLLINLSVDGTTQYALYRFTEASDAAGILYTDDFLSYESKFRTKEWLLAGAENYDRIKWAEIDYVTGVSTITINNLLTTNQSSIEVDATGWSLLTGTATLTRQTGGGHAGAATLRAEKTVGLGDVAVINNPLTTISVIPGRSYTASAWFLSITGGPFNCRVSIRWLDAISATISTTDGSNVVVPFDTFNWTQATVVATAPVNAVYAAVIMTTFSLTSGYYMKMDDVYLYQTPAVDPAVIATTYITDLETLVLPDSSADIGRSSYKFPGPGRCRRISCEISDSSGNNSVQILSMALHHSRKTKQSAARVS